MASAEKECAVPGCRKGGRRRVWYYRCPERSLLLCDDHATQAVWEGEWNWGPPTLEISRVAPPPVIDPRLRKQPKSRNR